MILPYLYQKHLFKKLGIRFLFILFALFFLYALVDYSVHMQDFLEGKKIRLIKLFGYYGCELVKRAELLLPLSFLIALISTLIRMNVNKELVALQSAGISLRNIFRPLWVIATLLFLLQIGNYEFVMPKARLYLDNFKYKHIKSIKRSRSVAPFYALYFDNGSKLFYLCKDSDKDLYHDVIWIKSLDEVWRMKTMHAQNDVYIGKFVDVIRRSSGQMMEKTESYTSYPLEGLHLKEASIYRSSSPPENLPLSGLLKNFVAKESAEYSKYEIRTEFYSKLFSSFLPFLALIAISPYCTPYRRNNPAFFIFTLSIFSFLAFKAMTDALKILGVNHVVSPVLAIGIPYFIVAIIAMRNYYKAFNR